MKKTILFCFGIASILLTPLKATETEIIEIKKNQFVDKIDSDMYSYIYEQFIENCQKKIKDLDDNIEWYLNTRRKDMTNIFDTLKIEIPQDLMLEIFDKYGVIVHRYPENEILIIGCGNMPPYTKGMNVHALDSLNSNENVEYREKHTHKHADTFDIDFARNSTLIGSLEWHDLTSLYQKYFNNHKYNHIHFEGYFPFEIKNNSTLFKNYENFFKAVLSNDGVVSFDKLGFIYKNNEGWIEKGKKLIPNE